MLFGNTIPHPTWIIRNEIIKKFNLYYDEEFNSAQDYNYLAAASKYVKLANIMLPLVKYRKHEYQIKNISKYEQQNNREIIQYNLLKTLEINISAEEFKLHKLIANENYNYIKNEINKVELWFTKLYNANLIAKAFSEKEFSETLSERWLKMCYTLFMINPKMIIDYINTKNLIFANKNCFKRFIFVAKSFFELTKLRTMKFYR